MTGNTCGCSAETCGCCEGTRVWTPVSTANRPGLPALAYRVGTHGTFFETMKARLASATVDGTGADGQTPETFAPLAGLTTRDPGDLSIALLDAWASVGDVLTFYQERVANEGYLRTATERRSVLELGRLVGYTPRPGVASTVYLAYTLEGTQVEPVEIPAGARSQSVPGPDELPQSFETSEALTARAAWNDLGVLRRRPQEISLANVLSLDRFYVAGGATNLKPGDSLLFVFGPGPDARAIRAVAEAEAQFAEDRTRIRLAPLPRGAVECLPVLDNVIAALEDLIVTLPASTTQFRELVLAEMRRQRRSIFLGPVRSPRAWLAALDRAYDKSDPDGLVAAATAAVENILGGLGQPGPVETKSPSEFVVGLLDEPKPQPADALRLARSLASELGRRGDAHPQLLLAFAPRLRDTFYAAWSSALATDATPALDAVYALRVSAPVFGAAAAKLPSYSPSGDPPVPLLDPPSAWGEWPLEQDEQADSLYLDQAYEPIQPGGYAVVEKRDPSGAAERTVLSIDSVATAQRAAYGSTGKSTRLVFTEAWRPEIENDPNNEIDLDRYRRTLVFAQSERLTPVDEEIGEDVGGTEIELARLYDGLASGRWVIVSGERSDIPGVSGVRASELLMISGTEQTFDEDRPGDTTHTTLRLATGTAYRFRRDTVKIYGNVVKATHGETRPEALGSGDASMALQSFELKQPPVTFVPAPTAAGAASTLEVFVDGVRWRETKTLAGLGPKDRAFVTATDDDGKTTVTFGTGREGARPPTGILNVTSLYRSGLGAAGNVRAGQVSLLQTRPLGVQSVVNPLGASGGADRETRDQVRENAPLAVTALDRLVSVRDYADFARTFAGIAKASARRVSDGRRQLIRVTVAGAADAPIDPTSDLHRNLLDALIALGDANVPVRVEARGLVVLVLSANVRLAADYLWEPVATRIRAALLDAFGFERRALGQPALLCEVVALVQRVEGVAYVDVDAFGGIPESADLEELADAAKEISVDASVAGEDRLAIFTPAVPGTIILNQIF